MRLHDAEQRPQAHDPFVFFSAKIPQRLPRKQPNDVLLSSYTVPITNFFPNQSLQFYSLSQHITNPKWINVDYHETYDKQFQLIHCRPITRFSVSSYVLEQLAVFSPLGLALLSMWLQQNLHHVTIIFIMLNPTHYIYLLLYHMVIDHLRSKLYLTKTNRSKYAIHISRTTRNYRLFAILWPTPMCFLFSIWNFPYQNRPLCFSLYTTNRLWLVYCYVSFQLSTMITVLLK